MTLTLRARQSMTFVSPVRDAGSCAAALEAQRAALEVGLARVPGLLGACLALLPASPTQAAGVLFECSFVGALSDLLFTLHAGLGAELEAVLSECPGFEAGSGEPAFSEYVGARARRSAAFRAADEPALELPWPAWPSVSDALPPLGGAPDAPLDEQELEARRSAVGMQEPLLGVPLLHVAWLPAAARARVKRALRGLELERAPLERDARFLLDGERLLFLAYPTDNAQAWSERLSHVALPVFTRVWRHCRGFPRFFGQSRARRRRRLQQFVLERRVPLAVWFNAREPLRSG